MEVHLGSDDGSIQVVTVFETRDTFALSLAKAALDDAGIAFLAEGRSSLPSAGGFQQELGLGGISLRGACACRIQVAPESAAAARALLEPLAAPEPAGGEKPDSP